MNTSYIFQKPKCGSNKLCLTNESTFTKIYHLTFWNLNILYTYINIKSEMLQFKMIFMFLDYKIVQLICLHYWLQTPGQQRSRDWHCFVELKRSTHLSNTSKTTVTRAPWFVVKVNSILAHVRSIQRSAWISTSWYEQKT